MNDPFESDIMIPQLLEKLECLTADLINFQKDWIKLENDRVNLDLYQLSIQLHIIEKSYYEVRQFQLNVPIQSSQKLAYDSILKISEIHFDTIEEYKTLLEEKELEQGIGQFLNLEKLKPLK